MTFDVVGFRTTFQEFQQTPDPTINGWVNLASSSAMAAWYAGATLTEQQLLVAHIGHMMTAAAAGDGLSGPVTSASEGSVSASFQPPPTKTALQHWLSMSPYGLQLWALLRVAAAAGAYVGGLPERSAFRKVGGIWA